MKYKQFVIEYDKNNKVHVEHLQERHFRTLNKERQTTGGAVEIKAYSTIFQRCQRPNGWMSFWQAID